MSALRAKALADAAPWEAMQPLANDYPMREVIPVSGNGRVIAHVNTAFGDGEEKARLIAAAPELLEFAKYVDRFNGSTGGLRSLVDEFKHRARVLIAIAEGK